MKNRKWNRDTLISAIREFVSKRGKIPTWTEVNQVDPGLAMVSYRMFGSLRLALKAAGFTDYPGKEKWRIRALRKADKNDLVEEINTSTTPSKLAIRALLKEKGFHRDPALIAALQKATRSEPRTRSCEKCGVPILPPRKYCAPCARIIKIEKTKARVKRFLSKPENAARYKEKRKLYYKRRYQMMPDEEKEKLREKYRQYYARKKAENPEALRIDGGLNTLKES
jgi:uncharacterized OB-fold protein